MPITIDYLHHSSEILDSPCSVSVCCGRHEGPEVDRGGPGYSHNTHLNSTHVAVVIGAFNFGSLSELLRPK